MKKTIEELLSGNFRHEHPQLLFSQDKIEVTLKAGDVYKGELYFGTEDNQKIRGYITSSNRRVVPGTEKFSGTTVRLQYGIDGAGMHPGERHEGWLCFTTDIGEYKLPFLIQTEKAELKSAAGDVPDMDTFVNIAKDDFKEAYRVFTDRRFELLLRNAGQKEKALYKGLSKQPVTFQHVEEFLIGTGKKDPVKIELKADQNSFYDISESVRETFAVQRSGWGHLRLEVEAKGDFLEVSRHVVTDEDFIGSYYQVEYVIRKEKLKKGRQFGEITVKSPYQQLTYQITASMESKVQLKTEIHVKRHKLELLRDLAEYSCKRMDSKTWIGSSRFVLNQLREEGCDYPEYQMYEAYILHMEEKDEQAREILKKFKHQNFVRENLELAGAYLYLCVLTGLHKDREQAIRRLYNFFLQKEDSFLLFKLWLEMNPEDKGSPSRLVFMMEELFEKGCRSPFLYLEAWNYISSDTTLLHRMSSFWTQVFLFAGEKGLLTEELVMRFAYLTGYEREFCTSMYRALAMGYDAFESDDTLEAICRYIMLGNPRKPEYFRWFSLAVEKGIRLTRIYEYYVETMDTSYQRELPKPLLMYFTYNNTSLADDKKAFIYASIVGNRGRQPQTYADYRDHMKIFAMRKAKEGRMNENYAVLYQEFLSNPKTEGQAKLLAQKLFTHRLYCDDKKIRYVIVRHEQLREEEIYPCIQGVAYPRIYTDDAVILFQDDKQRRYVSTIPYNLTKLTDESKAVPELLELGVRERGLLLYYCESTTLNADNLEYFQSLAELEDCTEEYRNSVRKQILDYYAANVQDQKLDKYLEKMDFRQYAQVDRTTLLEVLITRRMFRQAMVIVEEFGYEGLDLSCLLKMTSRMILKSDMAEDDELLALASEVYRKGKYDEVILHYLMLYRFGPLDELISIWKSARGFEMDTYDLEEKILSLLIFTEDYRKEGEAVLESYVKQSGKERITGAYLTLVSYGVFVREYTMSTFIRSRLEYAFTSKWPVNLICRLALLQEISREKDPKPEYVGIAQSILEECAKENLKFAFFRKLSPELLSPYQLDDKTFVECRAVPGAKVTLFYRLDTGLGAETAYKCEPLKEMYQGIFVRTFTLFYGETLQYYFQIDEGDKDNTKKTSERSVSMKKVEGASGSKYQMLNQMLSARRLDKMQEVTDSLKDYLIQEQYVKNMFSIEKESGR